MSSETPTQRKLAISACVWVGYHKRSNVESTFSMIKAKFRDHVRSKTPVAMVNESNPVHLGGFLPAPGSSPITHLGSRRKVHFVRKVWLKCTDGKQMAGAIRTIN